MEKFDYSAYYRRIQDLKKLQIPAQSICWTEQYRPPDRDYDVVLYLGCNILRTPDVAADVVNVFRALGLDFIAVAGVQFCCGVTWDRAGDIAKGGTISDLTIQRLGSYKSRVVVHWCPSCDVHFSDVVTGRDAKTIPFR
jgi:Fe-S oxidoreductase